MVHYRRNHYHQLSFKKGAYHLQVLVRVSPSCVGYLIEFRPPHLSRSLHVSDGIHSLLFLVVMLT